MPIHNSLVEFFAINTTLPIIAMLASKVFTTSKCTCKSKAYIALWSGSIQAQLDGLKRDVCMGQSM